MYFQFSEWRNVLYDMGDKLHAIMLLDDTNVKDTAMRCGLTQNTVRTILGGQPIGRYTILRLCKGLELDIEIIRPDRPPLGLMPYNTKPRYAKHFSKTYNGFTKVIPFYERPTPIKSKHAK